MCCVQVSDHGVLVMELGSGLSFPATEHLSHIMHTQALQGKDLFLCLEWSLPRLTTSSLAVFTFIYSPFNDSTPASPPRSVILDCHHVSIIDYSVISEIRDLLRQFKLRKVRLYFARLQVLLSTLTASQTFIEYRLLGIKCPSGMVHLFTENIFPLLLTLHFCLPPTFSPLFWRFFSQLICRTLYIHTVWMQHCRWSREPPQWLMQTLSNPRMERRCLMRNRRNLATALISDISDMGSLGCYEVKKWRTTSNNWFTDC